MADDIPPGVTVHLRRHDRFWWAWRVTLNHPPSLFGGVHGGAFTRRGALRQARRQAHRMIRQREWDAAAETLRGADGR